MLRFGVTEVVLRATVHVEIIRILIERTAIIMIYRLIARDEGQQYGEGGEGVMRADRRFEMGVEWYEGV